MAIANINETHASERRADISTRPPRIIGRTRGDSKRPIPDQFCVEWLRRVGKVLLRRNIIQKIRIPGESRDPFLNGWVAG